MEGVPRHKQKQKHHQIPQLEAPGDAFTTEKRGIVAKLWDEETEDKSRAGHADAQVIPLLRIINAKRHLYTASSCAGRLIVTLNRTNDSMTGYSIPWLFVSHDFVEPDAKAMLATTNSALSEQGDLVCSEVWFKLEPPILAIVCSSAECATKVMNLARGSAGIKRCSVISIRSDGAYVLSLTDTKRIEALLHVDGVQIADAAYVDTLVRVANRKLRESRARMDAFGKALAASAAFPDEEVPDN